MMATTHHVTSGVGSTKYQAAWVLLKSVKQCQHLRLTGTARITTNTVKDRQTVALLAPTVTTACVEELKRLHPYWLTTSYFTNITTNTD